MKKLNKYLLLIVAATMLTACVMKIELEEGGTYSELGAGAYAADDTAREFLGALVKFDTWVDNNADYVASSQSLARLANQVDRWITPPAEPDEPLTVYFAFRDTYFASREERDKIKWEEQTELLAQLATELLTATR
jgi:hypothetical protein